MAKYLQEVENDLLYGPEVQENVRSVKLETEVLPGTGGQGDKETGGMLGSVGGVIKKIEEMELRLVQLETNLIKKSQLRQDQEEKLIQVRTKLNKETQLRLRQEKKLTELLTKANEETQLRLTQEEKLRELHTKANEEAQLRELNTKQLRQQEILNFKEELHEEINLTTCELEKEKEGRVRLEERCAELHKQLEQVKLQQEKYWDATQQKKPQLTAEEHEEYAEQLRDACGRNGATPDVNKVRELLSMGVDCCVRSIYNNIPLHTAAWYGHTDVCKVLLHAAALINVRGNANHTPLHFAAMSGHLSAVRLLVECGADTNLRNKHGETALDQAVENNHNQVADYLSQFT